MRCVRWHAECDEVALAFISSFAFSPGRDGSGVIRKSVAGQRYPYGSAFPHRVLPGDGQKRPIVSHLDQTQFHEL
jgi:hypothetical protein